MNIYRVTCSKWSYDDYDGMVVAAPDEDTARKMDPTWQLDTCPTSSEDDDWGAWPVSRSELIITLIGEGPGPQRVILASYNAG